jgi:hypothetical protein
MKKTILFFFCFSLIIAKAYSITPASDSLASHKSGHKGFYTGLSFSRDNSTIQDFPTLPVATTYPTEFDPSAGKAYSAGIILGYTLGYWSLQSGISYSKIDEIVKYNYYAETDTDRRLQFTNRQGSLTNIQYTGTNSFTYISLPINLKYSIPICKLIDINIMLGVSVQYLSDVRGVMRYPDYSSVLQPISDKEANIINYASLISGGIAFHLTNHIEVEAAPTYAMIKFIYKNNTPDQILYSAVRYNFALIYRLH